MPKQKTRKCIAKRVKVTGTGKVMVHMAGSGHLKSRKATSSLRKMRKTRALFKAFADHAHEMLGG